MLNLMLRGVFWDIVAKSQGAAASEILKSYLATEYTMSNYYLFEFWEIVNRVKIRGRLRNPWKLGLLLNLPCLGPSLQSWLLEKIKKGQDARQSLQHKQQQYDIQVAVTYLYIHILVYIYMYIHVRVYIFMCIYTHVYMYVYIHIYVYAYIYTYTYIYIMYIYIYIQIHIHSYICTYINIYLYTQIHIHVYVYTYLNIHTHIHMWAMTHSCLPFTCVPPCLTHTCVIIRWYVYRWLWSVHIHSQNIK